MYLYLKRVQESSFGVYLVWDISIFYSTLLRVPCVLIVIFYGRFYTLFNQNINKLVKRFTTFLLDYWALVLGHDGMHSMCVWSNYLLVAWLR